MTEKEAYQNKAEFVQNLLQPILTNLRRKEIVEYQVFESVDCPGSVKEFLVLKLDGKTSRVRDCLYKDNRGILDILTCMLGESECSTTDYDCTYWYQDFVKELVLTPTPEYTLLKF